ncbi:uncharacterized protein LOC105281192 isoform X2 [Ooceraea biroi]|uniref:uncharacterized protein LOC105281192 isoform X2 n=1 Tax=Ooceraea biroi TaxID=2015173 RepID=UPI0005BE2730|nr:uncharacterized protein LOC105281192 isoform X2 [Ooceraea biroi]
MDDIEEVMSNEEHYKVIDEYMGEEESSIATQNFEEATGASKSKDTVKQKSSQASTDDAKSSNEVMNKSTAMDYELEVNNDAADSAADISFTELDTQKEVTDEDVMHHLDVIENIELDPETFGMQSMEKDTEFESSILKKEDDMNITIVDEVQRKWYEEKLAEKDALLKERLSKLARVLTVSYPSYEKWLERIEKIEGSPMCKLDPIRRCSLNKPHTNRWKFICSKIQVQESIKEEDNTNSGKQILRTVWRLEPMAAGGVNTDNLAEFPPFVLNAVKIFEDFLQTTLNDDAIENPNEAGTRKSAVQDMKQQWLWLLVRSNSLDELMLFATGKNISRSTMDRLKHTFESGSGKNCNVKSLYCKSMNKCDDKVVTTFLVGTEALDEIVGPLKVQLAPKTNFWSNAAGALNVAKTVADMLRPTQRTTVLEIGCGIGVIGLMVASKCREVIGVDSPSEIEEAEITTELNNIYNASFIVGSPAEVVNKLNSARDLHNKNRVTYCIINANTNMGRAIEVMTCLRKITSLRRIVMVTTLTKQSVRAILELARPMEGGLGHPFMPIRACIVDTLPTGPHFEAVILMERRLMHRLTQPWFIKMLEEESKSLENTKVLEKIHNDAIDGTDVQLRKNPLAKVAAEKSPKVSPVKKPSPVKSGLSSPVKSKIKLKQEYSPDISEIPKKIHKKFGKPASTPWQQVKKKNWFHENPALRINPLFDKKVRENKEKVDLREKLSSNRVDAELIQKVNESRGILEAAKEKLSGPSPTVDATTAKELKNVLSLVLDQTNKLQNQLPRSVWDRIAPPETDQKLQVKKELDDDPLLKGRFVQETRAQDIVITTANKEYLETEENKPKFKKYHNLAPLEPDAVLPVSLKYKLDKMEQKSSNNRNRQQNQPNSWNRNKTFDKNRWNDAEPMRKPASSAKRQEPFRHRVSPPRRFSPKRPLLSPPRHPCSPPRRHFSPNRPYQAHNSPHRDYAPQRRSVSPLRHVSPSDSRRQVSPPRRSFSPFNREMSPRRRSASSPRRSMAPMRQQMSPTRQPLSPSRRQMSPIGMRYDSSQMSPKRISPLRRPISPINREYQSAPTWRSRSPIGRTMSPSRSRDMIPRSQSPVRRFSPRRQSPPPNRIADEWDIPSRGAIEQSSTWQRSINEKPAENVWRNERQPTTSGTWQPPSNDRYRKPTNQEKSWDSSSQGNSWGVKQSSVRPDVKEPWQNSNNRWSGPRSGTGGENWNRGNESLGGRRESWMDKDKPRWEQKKSNDGWNQGDKDDWNDLPEDARDPWGDEGNLGLKERWMNLDNQPSSSWSREADKGDPWAKPKDSWQNKPQTFPAKPPCQSTSNPNESRWLPMNDMNKKVPSTNWQGGGNLGPWQSSNNYNFQSQSQRPFATNMFKDRR